MLFESALNLAPGAIGSGVKLYQWDAATDAVTLAGVLPDGTGALDSAAGAGHGLFEHRHAISADGRKVFFTAAVSGVQNLYMRLDGTSTVQLNAPEGGPGGPASAQYGDASVDGSRVFFTSSEQLTADAPLGGGLYTYDAGLPDSDPHNLSFLAPGGAVVGASADGHTVYFTSSSQLIPGQPPLPYPSALFVWHERALSFVANIPGEDQPGLTELFRTKTARVSPSGDVSFLSDEPTPANPAGSCPQSATRACDMLYVYSIATHRLACPSCNPAGAPPTASVATRFIISGGGESLVGHAARMITDDGRRVFFTSNDPLVPEDVNGKLDAYEYDVPTGTVHLISSGRSSADSYFLETTPSGDDALFYTREQLVGWDTDASYDVYDARVNGGFPDPTPASPVCNDEDCYPAPSAPPPVPPNSSQTTHTAGNRAHHKPHAKRCRHGQARKRIHRKTTCVRRVVTHPRHRKRHAGRSR